MTVRSATAVLALLLTAGAILIAVELGNGAASYGSDTVAGPCRPRPPFGEGGIDGTLQQIVLDGLDGAACRLGTTREELVLSLAPGSGVARRWSRQTIDRAIRAGLLRAVDAAARRGDLPSFAAPLLRELVERLPIDRLVEGGISLRELLP